MFPGCVVAATEITCTPAAGAPVVPSPGPELPEAATTTAPASAALLAATAVGSSGPPPPPRLMVMTFAFGFRNNALAGFALPCTVESVKGHTESSDAMIVLEGAQPPRR